MADRATKREHPRGRNESADQSCGIEARALPLASSARCQRKRGIRARVLARSVAVQHRLSQTELFRLSWNAFAHAKRKAVGALAVNVGDVGENANID